MPDTPTLGAPALHLASVDNPRVTMCLGASNFIPHPRTESTHIYYHSGNVVKKYSDANAALATWITIVRRADWKSGADVKATFSNSDLVGDKTHREYDEGDWK